MGCYPYDSLESIQASTASNPNTVVFASVHYAGFCVVLYSLLPRSFYRTQTATRAYIEVGRRLTPQPHEENCNVPEISLPARASVL